MARAINETATKQAQAENAFLSTIFDARCIVTPSVDALILTDSNMQFDGLFGREMHGVDLLSYAESASEKARLLQHVQNSHTHGSAMITVTMLVQKQRVMVKIHAQARRSSTLSVQIGVVLQDMVEMAGEQGSSSPSQDESSNSISEKQKKGAGGSDSEDKESEDDIYVSAGGAGKGQGKGYSRNANPKLSGLTGLGSIETGRGSQQGGSICGASTIEMGDAVPGEHRAASSLGYSASIPPSSASMWEHARSEVSFAFTDKNRRDINHVSRRKNMQAVAVQTDELLCITVATQTFRLPPQAPQAPVRSCLDMRPQKPESLELLREADAAERRLPKRNGQGKMTRGGYHVVLCSSRRMLPEFSETPEATLRTLVLLLIDKVNARGSGCCAWHIAVRRLQVHLRNCFEEKCGGPFLKPFRPNDGWQCNTCLAMNPLPDKSGEGSEDGDSDESGGFECQVCFGTEARGPHMGSDTSGSLTNAL
eukprot:TRINITY_DN5985_c1_g2_i3.p1 TRINITY_DN5985_c1_g2~~TRINITY_DN5985_c1_g2_i3.p1  ORF type:complete len:480 (-),score=67.50 TRINITY_DN5985_c1_g2_i3:200-1639(-)